MGLRKVGELSFSNKGYQVYFAAKSIVEGGGEVLIRDRDDEDVFLRFITSKSTVFVTHYKVKNGLVAVLREAHEVAVSGGDKKPAMSAFLKLFQEKNVKKIIRNDLRVKFQNGYKLRKTSFFGPKFFLLDYDLSSIQSNLLDYFKKE